MRLKKCSLDIFEHTNRQPFRLCHGLQDELGLNSFLLFVLKDYGQHQHHMTHQDHARRTTVSLQNADQDFVRFA